MDEPYKGQDWFVLEGTIEHFQWAEGHENLLEKIQHRASQKNAAAGAAAAALGQYGTLATSAMVAIYDSEHTEDFDCAINGKVIFAIVSTIAAPAITQHCFHPARAGSVHLQFPMTTDLWHLVSEVVFELPPAQHGWLHPIC